MLINEQGIQKSIVVDFSSCFTQETTLGLFLHLGQLWKSVLYRLYCIFSFIFTFKTSIIKKNLQGKTFYTFEPQQCLHTNCICPHRVLSLSHYHYSWPLQLLAVTTKYQRLAGWATTGHALTIMQSRNWSMSVLVRLMISIVSNC